VDNFTFNSSSRPTSFQPNMSQIKKAADPNIKACANCEKHGANLKCAKCKNANYCSKACQKQHWKNGHRELCFTPEERRPQTWTSRGSNTLRKPLGENNEGGNIGECPVCMECLPGGDPICTLPCKHVFHQECVENLRKHGVQQVCPLCRAELPVDPEEIFKEATRLRSVIAREVGFDLGNSLMTLSESFETLSRTPNEQKMMTLVINMYKSAANQNHAKSQYALGMYYHLESLYDQDCNMMAVQWYGKAGDQGHAFAQNNLGAIYHVGEIGVAQDLAKAVEWYRKAASQGNANAQYNLGTMYNQGLGVARDYEEALCWFRKAFEQGLVEASGSLTGMYYNGASIAEGRGLRMGGGNAMSLAAPINLEQYMAKFPDSKMAKALKLGL